jgi:glycine cleavage system H protein
MGSPSDRRYLDSHEWHKAEAGGLVTVGLSKFAVDELTDITFVDLRKRQGPIKAGESFGEIESVKATSELYCGIDGNVVACNQEVIDNPALVNQDPYGKGWLIKVQAADSRQVEQLLGASEYDAKVGQK